MHWSSDSRSLTFLNVNKSDAVWCCSFHWNNRPWGHRHAHVCIPFQIPTKLIEIQQLKILTMRAGTVTDSHTHFVIKAMGRWSARRVGGVLHMTECALPAKLSELFNHRGKRKHLYPHYSVANLRIALSCNGMTYFCISKALHFCTELHLSNSSIEFQLNNIQSSRIEHVVTITRSPDSDATRC